LGTKRLDLMLAVLLLVTPACVPSENDAASPPGRQAAPPARGDWNILEDVVVGSDLTVNGNVTVFSRSTLRIDNASAFTAMGTGAARFWFRVMVGASVLIANGSRLMVDEYESEPGTGLSLTGGSMLSARRSLNATIGHPTVLDSSITVTSGEGEDAVLRINCSSWGDFQRSGLSVIAGDGADGEPGMDGRAGGVAAVHLVNAQLYGCNLTASAGRGGNAGDPPDDSFAQGKGGVGGPVSARLDLNYISGCRIVLAAGSGGDGPAGQGLSPDGPRSGGAGGPGGDASLMWNGTNLLFSDSALTLTAGDGGRGGDGADAPEGSFDGGNGADGGAGGAAGANVLDLGTFTFLNSRFNATAGDGGPAGRFGLGRGSGRDGGSGNGGAGGGAPCSFLVWDTFTGSNSVLAGRGGAGAAGGLGPVAGDGGAGGMAGINISVATFSSTAALLLERSTLSARGGRGGSGGKGFSTSSMNGIPGRGGTGGASDLAVGAEGRIRAGGTDLDCLPGAGGASDMPARSGTEGPARLSLATDQGDLANCTVSQTIGPVDGNDRWTLVNTCILHAEHFNVSGKGIAEEYWIKRVTVKDVGGAAIMDGSVTVEVRRNGTLLESRKSNSRGESEFQLLDTLYTASGVQYRSYVLSAYDSLGRASQQITVFWSADLFIDLVLVSKLRAPLCSFLRPAPGNITIINASEYAGLNGTGQPFFVTGYGRDSPGNDEPGIENVQLRFGETGPWLCPDLVRQGDAAIWNLSWDIYTWAGAMLSAYPLGIIPLTIYARSFNGYNWSDDASRGGAVTSVNLTVRLLRLPGPPPKVELTSPARSTAEKTAEIEARSGRQVSFNARVAFTNGRQILRWVWCFDDTGGFREDLSSNVSPAASFVYPAEREGQYLFAILKVYDNESARRVELLRAGVAYDEFGYSFDPQDGSTRVRVRILVRAPPDEKQASPPPYWALVVIAVGAGLGLWLFRVRKKM